MAKKESNVTPDTVQAPTPIKGTETPEAAQEAPGEMENAGVQQVQQPPLFSGEDQGEEQGEEQSAQSGQKHVDMYKITCRNKISKAIGGVSFVNGVGYTSDGFTASWFGNKDGYEVKETGS